MIKSQNHVKSQDESYTQKRDRKINLNDIEFDENKLKEYLLCERKRDVTMIIILTTIMCRLMTNLTRVLTRVAMNMRESRKRKKSIKKKTVTKTKPTPIKQKKKQQKRNYRLSRQLIGFKYFFIK